MVENEESNDNGFLSQKSMDKEDQKISDKQSKLLNVELSENAVTVIFRITKRKSFLDEVKELSSGTINSNGVNRSVII